MYALKYMCLPNIDGCIRKLHKNQFQKDFPTYFYRILLQNFQADLIQLLKQHFYEICLLYLLYAFL